MKLCFSTLGCSEKSLSEVLMLAREYHIHALEIRGLDGVMDNRQIEALNCVNREQTAMLFAQENVVPHVLGTSCSFHRADKYAAAVEEGKACIDIAARLDIPYIRVFGNNLTGDTEEERAACTARVISGISEVCGYAASTAVTVLLEVHGDYNKIETLKPVTDALSDYANFGLIWDIAHTKAYGEEWPTFYRVFKPCIKHIHIKDYTSVEGKLVLPGEGDLPILPIVRTLLADGYDGYFSLEWEKKWHPELPEIQIALERFVSLMKQA